MTEPACVQHFEFHRRTAQSIGRKYCADHTSRFANPTIGTACGINERHVIRWLGEDALLWANRDTGFALYANARFGNHIRQVDLACSGSPNRVVVG